jgi:tetratricopeptide (TPR) repeat protein
MSREVMALSRLPKSIAGVAAALIILAAVACWGQESNRAKAHALVDAAIQMSDTEQAVKSLWQATDIDPTLNEPYIYLGLFYNSREDFAKVVEVYKKLVKYQPREVSAYLNIGEAYMSFTPPKYQEALASYKKAYEIDPHSAFAALRIGQILAHQGNRAEAQRYLKQAVADSGKNATVAAEAQKELRQLGAF